MMQAFEKAAEAEGDEARQQMIETFDRMAAFCKDWLVSNEEPMEGRPVPGLSDVHFTDYTRRVQVPTNVPADVEALTSFNEVYVAEGNLLNNTQRALMEHHLRFNKEAGNPGHAPVAEVMRSMQAMAAKLREFVRTSSKTSARLLTPAAERPMR